MIIAVTGGFGTGKTAVAGIFGRLGCFVLNVDKLYGKLIAKNSPLYFKIINKFGTSILDKNKNIDRDKLKQIVFNNSKKLRQLNKITHPLILKEIKKEINSFKKLMAKKILIIDIPLLFESKSESLVDKIVVVKTDSKTQMKRLIKKGKYTKAEIRQIIKSQLPLSFKIKKADFVVDNSKEIEYTKKQIEVIYTKLIR